MAGFGDGLNFAVLLIFVVVLLCLFPETRPCTRAAAPWLALAGGGLILACVLSRSSPRFTGGSAGKRRRVGRGESRGESEGYGDAGPDPPAEAAEESFFFDDAAPASLDEFIVSTSD